jgi:hypothetical protein
MLKDRTNLNDRILDNLNTLINNQGSDVSKEQTLGKYGHH